MRHSQKGWSDSVGHRPGLKRVFWLSCVPANLARLTAVLPTVKQAVMMKTWTVFDNWAGHSLSLSLSEATRVHVQCTCWNHVLKCTGPSSSCAVLYPSSCSIEKGCLLGRLCCQVLTGLATRGTVGCPFTGLSQLSHSLQFKMRLEEQLLFEPKPQCKA